jgi:hypothetical protein
MRQKLVNERNKEKKWILTSIPKMIPKKNKVRKYEMKKTQ